MKIEFKSLQSFLFTIYKYTGDVRASLTKKFDVELDSCNELVFISKSTGNYIYPTLRVALVDVSYEHKVVIVDFRSYLVKLVEYDYLREKVGVLLIPL